ncbi:hypothetical protein ASPZODRAFT_29252 [Penicilliopsis zonata CBS 506.65]|uniref:Uncharacterized protein n=1 Tax=Penicilliopsis zonata CBS 506.65 TaxID=1073090 RepID=A0A1L9S5H8_9EURO|nr:hypothetical protein ASPZODRAFT_29252 [Penicilliopsis zonata CBS 506.65]OJJ42409.1 hypothetical protein ASPZODRAFT_29252 [Penicilliopsis zonata CBS 506.65]
MAAFASSGIPPSFRRQNNRVVYTVCAVVAGGFLLHRWYSTPFAEKDALPFPYSERRDIQTGAMEPVKDVKKS